VGTSSSRDGSISFVFGATVRALRRTIPAATVAVLLLALAILTGGGAWAGRLALAQMTADWRADLRLIVTLREPPREPDGRGSVVTAVRLLPGVSEVRYVSPDDALGELRRYLAGGGGGVEGLDRLPANPVPARLEVTPAPTLDAAGLRRLVETLGRDPSVDDVAGAFDWVAPVERVDRVLRLGGIALAGILAFGALVAIGVSATAVRYLRTDETAILRLAGVSEARLRGPLVLVGTVEGLVGGLVGVACLWLVSDAGAPWLGSWLDRVGFGPLPVLPVALLRGSVGGAVLLGALGGLAGGRP
jgi:cell division transport system permease protein